MSATWSDAPMPTASAIPAQTPAFEELLEQVLTGEGGDRLRAMLTAIRLGMGDLTVADHHCGPAGEPRVYRFRQFCRHVFDVDHPAKVAARGHRAHNTVNVEPWDPETPGRGPGLNRGVTP